MTPETKAALIAKLQDDSVKIQSKYRHQEWQDTDENAYEMHKTSIEAHKYFEYRIKPSTVSLAAVELPKPEITSKFFARELCASEDYDRFTFDTRNYVIFKTESDAQQWADYLNSVLSCIEKE